jgi:hypothetical protein
MASATAPPFKAVRGANFASKRERKRVRKGLARAALANFVAEARTGAAERAEFYRRLRHMKLRRMEVAKKMVALSITVGALQQQLRRVEDRGVLMSGAKTAAEKAAERKMLADLDAAMDLGRAAMGAVQAAAAEWQLFAKQKIYFTEVVG